MKIDNITSDKNYKILTEASVNAAFRLAEEKKAKLEAEEAETRKLIEEIKARQEAAKKD